MQKTAPLSFLANNMFVGKSTDFRRHIRLAWPISLQLILANMLGIIDLLMVGTLGNAAVAAVGTAGKILLVVILLLVGASSTVGLLVAQFYGSEQFGKIRSVTLFGMTVGVIIGAIATIASMYGSVQTVSVITDDPETVALGASYMVIVTPAFIALGMVMVLEGALRSMGQVRVPMVISIGSVGLNIILNYWLIFGGLGVPAMGVEGAAMATSISRVAHLMLFIAYIYLSKNELRFSLNDVRVFWRNTRVIQFIKLTLPVSGGLAIWSLGLLAYQFVYGHMGTEELAIISMVHSVEGILMAIFVGLGTASSIIIGQYLGSNDFESAKREATRVALFMPMMAFSLGLLLLLFHNVVFMIFSDLPKSTQDYASKVMIVMCLLYWLKVANLTIVHGVLRAGGDNVAYMIVDAFGMWCVSIPLVYYTGLSLDWSLVFVFMVSFSEEVTKLVIYIFRLRQGVWLRNIS